LFGLLQIAHRIADQDFGEVVITILRQMQFIQI